MASSAASECMAWYAEGGMPTWLRFGFGFGFGFALGLGFGFGLG